ncbi:MAG: hypothetical protein ACXIUB_12195 [Wenzhouxiangella sp.]
MHTVIDSWTNYSAGRPGGSILAGGLLGLFALLLAWSIPADGSERQLVVETGPGRLLDWHWQGASLTRDQTGWTVALQGLGQSEQVWLDQVTLACPRAETVAEGCASGTLRLRGLGHELGAQMTLASADGYWTLGLSGDQWLARLDVPAFDERPLRAELALERWPLDRIPLAWLEILGLNLLVGEVSGQLVLEGEHLTADFEVSDAGFDSPDGRLAGDALTLGLQAAARIGGPGVSGKLALHQSSGEWLLDALYLPPPPEPLTLELAWEHAWGGRLDLTNITLADGPALAINGSLSLLPDTEAGWQVERASVRSGQVNLSRAWPRWAEGPVAAAGFPELITAGRVDFELDWQPDHALSATARLQDLALIDPQGRFAFARVDGQIQHGAGQGSIDLDWVAMALWGLPLGGGSLSLVPEVVDQAGQGLRLARPLRVPLLDGAVVLDRLAWRPGQDPPLTLDARIETLSLTELTRALNWPEFGGQLAAEFPGVALANERLDFTGGIDIEAFSGHISLAELAIERPFGTLPAVSAQLQFDRLDLAELTGAFNFGRMDGQASGWARNLRLLDWRPVAMDARIFTHEDVPRRRISQRAVDNLTSLGGAGGALINTTVLAVFDDFPYRRAGLACRLSNNICHLDGVAPHESGGFYIVQGRGLPRLNVIGHRRLMDWPQFVGQLEAIMD